MKQDRPSSKSSISVKTKILQNFCILQAISVFPLYRVTLSAKRQSNHKGTTLQTFFTGSFMNVQVQIVKGYCLYTKKSGNFVQISVLYFPIL